MLDEVPRNSRVIGLGRCMEKTVGEITKKVGGIIERVGVYTGNQYLSKICHTVCVCILYMNCIIYSLSNSSRT